MGSPHGLFTNRPAGAVQRRRPGAGSVIRVREQQRKELLSGAEATSPVSGRAPVKAPPVLYQQPLTRGRLICRYQRFLADVRLDDGRVVTCHCANPGSMKTCLQQGAPVWLSRADSPHRKLPWTWEWTEIDGVRIFVNPSRANAVVIAAVKSGAIAELAGYSVLRREVPYAQRSRIDFLLDGPSPCYVEVKNVTLDLGGGRAAFPDSVTKRGLKHLVDLQGVVRGGGRAVLFFCVGRDDARSVEPAEAIDPAYAAELRRAVAGGVEVMAYRCRMDPEGVELHTPLPVQL
jgi:sugar fermentation stimulation protein A